MSPRAKREDKVLTGAALRQAIREEIERQMGAGTPTEEGGTPQEEWGTPLICPHCPQVFTTKGALLAHDIDSGHFAERVSKLSRKAGGQG